MLGLLVLAAIGPWTGTGPVELHLRANFIGRIIFVFIWVAIGGVAAASFIANGSGDRHSVLDGLKMRSVAVSNSRSWRTWFPAAVLVANGLMPFIGLKTEHSFTMFSNVQTEGELWNHYVFPRSMRLFHFQDDLIRVLNTDDPTLSRIAGTEVRLVLFDLRNRVEANPAMKIRYEYRGRIYATNAAGRDPILGRSNSALLQRLLLFRPVQPADQNRCVH